jgi:hypothetical protein
LLVGQTIHQGVLMWAKFLAYEWQALQLVGATIDSSFFIAALWQSIHCLW